MSQQKKVMIADDDPGILDAVEAMLEFGGYEVSSTANGATSFRYERWLSGFTFTGYLDVRN